MAVVSTMQTYIVITFLRRYSSHTQWTWYCLLFDNY